jgi:DNA-binding transcriptional LysR family regulator
VFVSRDYAGARRARHHPNVSIRDAMDRIAALRAFVQVAQDGSFTRAADALDLPKTTLTRLVNDLEADLAVRLLLRSSRSLRLTEEGERYRTRAVRFLSDLEDIEGQTRQAVARPSGHIRVEMTTALASAVVVPALKDFNTRYPDIQVELQIGARSHSLVADSIDCALRLGVPEDEFLVVRKIGEYQAVTCAAPDYFARHGMPRRVADLAEGHVLVALLASGTHRALPFRFRRGDGEIEIAPTGEFTFSDANAYLAAGVAGLGLLQAPGYMLCGAISEGTLVPVLQEHAVAGSTPAYVAYPPNRYLSAKVRVFIDWLVEVCERSPFLRRHD